MRDERRPYLNGSGYLACPYCLCNVLVRLPHQHVIRCCGCTYEVDDETMARGEDRWWWMAAIARVNGYKLHGTRRMVCDTCRGWQFRMTRDTLICRECATVRPVDTRGSRGMDTALWPFTTMDPWGTWFPRDAEGRPYNHADPHTFGGIPVYVKADTTPNRVPRGRRVLVDE